MKDLLSEKEVRKSFLKILEDEFVKSKIKKISGE